MNRKIEIKQLFSSLQTQMEEKLNLNRNCIPHPVAKGDATELNWIEWLRTYLPKRYTVDKAFIIDSCGNMSDQIDVVIYDRQYSPFIFVQDGIKYIPIESVYAVFEVKQDVSKQNIEYAGEKAKSVRELKGTSVPIPYAGGTYDKVTQKHILSGILALSSDWKPALSDSFEKSIFGLDEKSELDCGCVLSASSFWVDNEKKKIEKSTKDEVLIFFFLKLLEALQKMGTAPAIDILDYGKALDSLK